MDASKQTQQNQTLEAIRYTRPDSRSELHILNQLLLPKSTEYDKISNCEDGWNAIRTMKVRGAPAIAIVGVLSLAVELQPKTFKSVKELAAYTQARLEYLVTARPTAVNMGEAAARLTKIANNFEDSNDADNVAKAKYDLIEVMEQFLPNDIADNKAIGDFGANAILAMKPKDAKVTILTHCNTGSLATAGYGTALGVIRSLFLMGRIEHVYCTETRPYNQGARLTAFELVYEGIPASLICDSMASSLMREKGVDAVVVGADRVVANGDTANKIGTYQLAIAAKYHGVKFYVAAPKTSIDINLSSGSDIEIEERPAQELHYLNGQRLSADGIGGWNPAFDVTPAALIDGIITEKGLLYKKDDSSTFDMNPLFPSK